MQQTTGPPAALVTRCQPTCTGSEFYQHTRMGLDTMLQRFMDLSYELAQADQIDPEDPRWARSTNCDTCRVLETRGAVLHTRANHWRRAHQSRCARLHA